MRNWVIGLLVGVSLGWGAVSVSAQDDKPKPAEMTEARVMRVLPYLSSDVPEHRAQSERLLRQHAKDYFEALVVQLADLPPRGRAMLLSILVATEHDEVVSLCVDTLCRADARRGERVTVSRALRDADRDRVFGEVQERLQKPDNSDFVGAQLARILGFVASAKSQGLAEEMLENTPKDSPRTFNLEDALLRSVLESSFAQPAWARYQRRHSDAPKIELRNLQKLLNRLTLPLARDRLRAATLLRAALDDDVRIYLALARSQWIEEASFALARLADLAGGQHDPKILAVMLDVATTSDQTTALLAVDVAKRCLPPTEKDLESMRPYVSDDAMRRLQAVIEGLTRNQDLGKLRARARKIEEELRPIMLRDGAFTPRARKLLNDLARAKSELDAVEKTWRAKWNQEFRNDILDHRAK